MSIRLLSKITGNSRTANWHHCAGISSRSDCSGPLLGTRHSIHLERLLLCDRPSRQKDRCLPRQVVVLRHLVCRWCFLYKYHGFSKNENNWLSLAGLFALGVAVFPMSLNGQQRLRFHIGVDRLVHSRCTVSSPCWHLRALPSSSVWYADSTLSELKTVKPAVYKQFKRAYFFLAAYMVMSIGASISCTTRTTGWVLTFWRRNGRASGPSLAIGSSKTGSSPRLPGAEGPKSADAAEDRGRSRRQALSIQDGASGQNLASGVQRLIRTRCRDRQIT